MIPDLPNFNELIDENKQEHGIIKATQMAKKKMIKEMLSRIHHTHNHTHRPDYLFAWTIDQIVDILILMNQTEVDYDTSSS